MFSFGIIMWELAARATPWPELQALDDDIQVFAALNTALMTGRRPAVPAEAATDHPDFVAVLTACWASDPADRPTFQEAVPRLAACLRSILDAE